jgi:HAD superfamily hydrolase (TIGR01484 family)
VHTNATGEPPGGERGLNSDGNDPRLRLAEEMAFNRSSLGNIGYGATHVASTFPETGRQYVRFFWKNQGLLQDCQSAADVAVLRSFASMSFNSYRPHQETILAEQALIQAQVPFDILYDKDLVNLSKYKVLVIAEEPQLDRLQAELTPLYRGKVHIVKSKPHFLEFSHINATKGDALAYLAHHFGVKREEIMAVGDSFNDIEMLEYAGVGVVVANAREEIKKIANYITSKPYGEGVVEALERYVLGDSAHY